MKFSKLYCPTLKEAPRDAEVKSHQLMLRAGLMRKVASGIYTLLPLGHKVLQKFANIVREEMNKADALEVTMPVVIPSELWQESGRWEKYGKELCRLEDRHGNDFCLGPTHEEVITTLVKGELSSYKHLPLNFYQIQTKFRDEVRPRFGLMRGREFLMKDAYSFHKDESCLNETYQAMARTYKAIFNRCGLESKQVVADSGSIGGDASSEFMIMAQTGEDAIFSCDACDYAANLEAAAVIEARFGSAQATKVSLEKVETPGKATIEDVGAFLNLKTSDCMKCLVYTYEKRTVAVLMRGDHQLNEHKLQAVLGGGALDMASEESVMKAFNSPIGYLGPVGLEKVQILADYSIQEPKGWCTGANEKDFHLTNAVLNRDFKVTTFADLRDAQVDDVCPQCKKGKLVMSRGIEVGHIFKLGTTYSKKMAATFLDESGKAKAFEMGCYGIGIGRTVAATIEQSHDDKGIIWPKSLAPYEVVVTISNTKLDDLNQEGHTLYEDLKIQGIDVLLDDRAVGIGFKFKDAELIGFPVQIVVGKTWQETQEYEVIHRKSGEKKLVTKADLMATIQQFLS